MLGIADPVVWLAYVLCILSALVCFVYGAIKWNAGAADETQPEDVKWAKHEAEIEDKL